MKISELRIGNYVKIDGVEKPMKVLILDSLEVSSTPFLPIPLTEEWLLKLGFNKDYKNGWIGIDVKNESGMTTDFVLAEPLNMGEWQKYYAFVYDSYRFTKLKHVHQLQNLYFALTNEELTIAL